MSKQAILDNVKASLQANPLATQSSHYVNPMKSTNTDKIQEYITLQNANKAIVIESSPDALIQDIHKALVEAQAHKILYNLNIKDTCNIESLRGLKDTDSMEFIAYEKSVVENRGKMPRDFPHSLQELVSCCLKNLPLCHIFMMAYAHLKLKVKMVSCRLI